jgi:hypothetical protein
MAVSKLESANDRRIAYRHLPIAIFTIFKVFWDTGQFFISSTFVGS